MKYILKKLFIIVTVVGVLLGLPLTAFADDTTKTGTDGMEANVEVNGSIEATTISITHPATLDFSVNGSPLAPLFSVKNNTLVSIKVTAVDLSSTTGGTLTFTDVNEADKIWSNLSLTDSKKYISLKVIANPSEWTNATETAMQATTTEPMVLGELASLATGSIKLDIACGKAFDQTYTAKAALILRFNIV